MLQNLRLAAQLALGLMLIPFTPQVLAQPTPPWSHPLSVWVEPLSPQQHHFLSLPQQHRLAISPTQWVALLNQWQPALPFPLTLTSQESGANIRVQWVRSIDPSSLTTPVHSSDHTPFISGLTTLQHQPTGLQQATIHIALVQPSGLPRTRLALIQTALHELGHALGYTGHSPVATDVMAGHNARAFTVSQHDIALLKALYRTQQKE
ncbi:MAG: hypothetical protein U0003_00785 [Vampirovibrionales bacterium]